LNSMEIFYPMRLGSLGKRSSRPEGLNISGKTTMESLMMKLLPKLGTFLECITFYLQQVFRHDTCEALKYYITKALRKPNPIPIHQFLVGVEQFNSYLKTLPCLYYSPITNQATEQILSLDNADLMTQLL